jgi:hypothetical protein
MDRYKLRQEILELTDTSPLISVDIASIINKYASGLEKGDENEVRVNLKRLLLEMRKEGEIDFNDADIGGIPSDPEGIFRQKSVLVHSTIKRQNEIENKKMLPIIQIGEGSSVNIINGNRGENIVQKSSVSKAKEKNQDILLRLWELISNNALISSLILIFLTSLPFLKNCNSKPERNTSTDSTINRKEQLSKEVVDTTSLPPQKVKESISDSEKRRAKTATNPSVKKENIENPDKPVPVVKPDQYYKPATLICRPGESTIEYYTSTKNKFHGYTMSCNTQVLLTNSVYKELAEFIFSDNQKNSTYWIDTLYIEK